jgi:hypothetical protein
MVSRAEAPSVFLDESFHDEGVLALVQAELALAREKFPRWPVDPLHAAAIIQEEAGELAAAILQVAYEPGKATRPDVWNEAIQVAATALRFLANFDRYDYLEAYEPRTPPDGQPGQREKKP